MIKSKSLIFFALSVAVSLAAASYRFYDSAHVIGTIKQGGAMSRHPALLDGKLNSATLIVTAKVIPPYRGNARIALEGMPGTDYVVYDTIPAVRLPFHSTPEFHDNVLHDLRSNDRIALWVVMKNKGGLGQRLQTRELAGASLPETSHKPHTATDKGWKARQGMGQPDRGPMLAFYDTHTSEPLLKIPIRFIGSAGGRHGE